VEPILTIKEVEARDQTDKSDIEYLLELALRTEGAAYDHIGFSWVSTGDNYTVYGYGWWDA
jgi:hypothetical protein